ncbi:Brix domain-containing protein [Dipodascopsis uninucleata]
MVKRRQKKRTHVKAPNPLEAKTPQSMVIRAGGSKVGLSLSQLVMDVRSIMQPHTAIKLKERKSNKIKDYLTMTGPLGVSHLLIFSKTQSNDTSLRIAHTPRGPTIHFRLISYSLCKDLRRFQRHPRTPSSEFLNPPLLVLNGFQVPASSETALDKAHYKVLTSMFQNMFPAITATSSALKKIKRVMLINMDQETGHVYVRHYLISTKTLTGKSQSKLIIKEEDEEENKVKIEEEISMFSNEDEIDDRDIASGDDEDDVLSNGKFSVENDSSGDDDEGINAADDDRFLPAGGSAAARAKLQKILLSKKRSKRLPRLGNSRDIADYVLNDDAEMSAVTSESEADDDDMFDSSILDSSSFKSKSATDSRQKAVKLIEIGPRLKLQLIKIQEGVCEGDVLYHAFKSKDEIRKENKLLSSLPRKKQKKQKEATSSKKLKA